MVLLRWAMFAHQLHGRAEALFDVFLDLLIGVLGNQHAPIALAEPQSRHIFFVHGDDPGIAALYES